MWCEYKNSNQYVKTFSKLLVHTYQYYYVAVGELTIELCDVRVQFSE